MIAMAITLNVTEFSSVLKLVMEHNTDFATQVCSHQ